MNNSTLQLDPSRCPRCGAALDEITVQGLCAACLAASNFATDSAWPDSVSEAAGTKDRPPIAPQELAVHFPQLEIVEFLGRGGMGVVYKARQKSLGRLVALKLLAPERAEDPDFAKRFAQEAQALAAFNHPNIVTIYDFGQAGGFYYLLMEFVDGINLRQAMTAGRLKPEQALAIVPPVCEALQYAHDHQIVHRDIKPENLLLDKEGRVKIADFGIAKMLGAECEADFAESQPAGTPQYMAPEQKLHLRTDHRADIYSLGVVLYEMLTGELPTAKLQPPSKRVQVDVRIDEIVLRALALKPELRYSTAAEFQAEVQDATLTSVTGRSSPAPQSRYATIGAACFAISLIAFLVFSFTLRMGYPFSSSPQHGVWTIQWMLLVPAIVFLVIGLVVQSLKRRISQPITQPTRIFPAERMAHDSSVSTVAAPLALMSFAIGGWCAFWQGEGTWLLMALSLFMASMAILMAMPMRRSPSGTTAIVIASLGILIWPLLTIVYANGRSQTATVAQPTAPTASVVHDSGQVKVQLREHLDRAYQVGVEMPHRQNARLTEQYVCQIKAQADSDPIDAYYHVSEARYLALRAAKLDEHLDDFDIELMLSNGMKFDQPGRLVSLGSEANPGTGNFTFHATFPNPDHLLRNGMTGVIRVSHVKKNVLLIPQKATFELLDKRYVFVVDDHQVASPREIEIQFELDDSFVVKSGIDETTRIVVDGVRLLLDE